MNEEYNLNLTNPFSTYALNKKIGNDLNASLFSSGNAIADKLKRYYSEQRLLQNIRKNHTIGTVQLMIPAAIDFASSVYNGFQYDKTADDLSSDYGTSNGLVLGVNYTRLNIADSRQVMSEEHADNVSSGFSNVGKGAAVGAMAGSILPGLGTVAGGLAGAAIGGIASLLGGGHRHAKAREALALQKQQALRTNDYNRSLAMTSGMLQDYYKEYGNPENQILLTANGKDAETEIFNNMYPFNTKTINAVKKPEEPTIHSDGTGEFNGGGIPNKDSVPVHLLNNDAVLTNDYIDPWTGVTFAKEAEPIIAVLKYLLHAINKNKGENENNIAVNASKRIFNATGLLLLDIANRQSMARDAGLIPQEQVGYAARGIDNWGNVAQTIAGITTAIGGYLLAKKSKVHNPDIRVRNRYEDRVVNDLYSLRPDNLAVIRQLRNAEARGKHQIMSFGGLGAGQKALALSALTANTQTSTADALAQSQDRFNTIRANANNVIANIGAESAKLGQTGLQYNNTSYQQGASARLNIMRDYLAQIPKMIGQYYNNWYTARMGNDMLDLYRQKVKLDTEALKRPA